MSKSRTRKRYVTFEKQVPLTSQEDAEIDTSVAQDRFKTFEERVRLTPEDIAEINAKIAAEVVEVPRHVNWIDVRPARWVAGQIDANPTLKVPDWEWTEPLMSEGRTRDRWAIIEERMRLTPEQCTEIDARLADPNYVPRKVEWLDAGPDPFGMNWKWMDPPKEKGFDEGGSEG